MKDSRNFTDIVVFGSRGTSLMILRGMEDYWRGRVRVRAMIDETRNGFEHPLLRVPVISMDDRLRDYPDVPVLVTPASTSLRARVFGRLDEEGATLATSISTGQNHVDPAVEYGPGCLCVPYTRVGPNVRIGEGAQVMATLVAHDIEIGAFCNLNVNCSVLGHVRIGPHAHIAPHAVIANGSADKPLVIGEGAVIGVGAVVVRDVPPGARVGGNPAMDIARWKKLNALIDQMPE